MDEKVVERFWSHVDKSGGENSCWLWVGAKTRGNYGNFSINRKPRRAHRVSYEIAHGAIPGKLFCLHTCDNPPCVNPAHLFLGTNQDNMTDCTNKKRFPSGDKHWFHKGSKAASGDRNGSRTHPERLSRGENHSSKLHPARGEQTNVNKLTEKDVIAIRKMYSSGSSRSGHNYCKTASDYNVSDATISRVVRNKTWTWLKEI